MLCMYGPSTSARRNSQHQEAPQTLGTAPHSTTSSCTCRTGCKSWAGSGLGPGLVVAVKAVLGGCLGSSPSICGGCASACTGCLSVPWSMEWPTSLPSRNRALFNRACERLCCIFPRKEKKKRVSVYVHVHRKSAVPARDIGRKERRVQCASLAYRCQSRAPRQRTQDLLYRGCSLCPTSASKMRTLSAYTAGREMNAIGVATVSLPEKERASGTHVATYTFQWY